ncbi:26S proteasome regulatory subunit 10B-like [Artemia franciscana]|uniref:26S proteasome regulatory subunit 10B-like n=1 Tax=Artemia franciscana TaxID=6661 RepID=UPI0032DA8CF6
MEYVFRWIQDEGTTSVYQCDYEAIVKLTDGFNGADLRNICTEADLFAIRADRDYIIEEDLMKAARKVSDNKKLESKLDY